MMHASLLYQSNLCPEIVREPIMVLRTIDDYMDIVKLQNGSANASIIYRNILNLPFTATCVVMTDLIEQYRDDVEAWCRESLSGDCRMEIANCKVYFEYEDDGLLFLLRWKGEGVCHSY